MYVDCTCSIDESDESTRSEGRDCEYGSLIFSTSYRQMSADMLYELRKAQYSVASHVQYVSEGWAPHWLAILSDDRPLTWSSRLSLSSLSRLCTLYIVNHHVRHSPLAVLVLLVYSYLQSCLPDLQLQLQFHLTSSPSAYSP